MFFSSSCYTGQTFFNTGQQYYFTGRLIFKQDYYFLLQDNLYFNRMVILLYRIKTAAWCSYI